MKTRRAITVAPKMSRRAFRQFRAAGEAERKADLVELERPRARGDCAGVPRPCPFVSCRHHLFLDVTPSGGLKLNYPHLEPDEMAESCVLDVADRGASTLEEAGELLRLTRERIRQVEVRGLLHLRMRGGGLA